MSYMEHLNVTKGKVISDYEALFIMIEKLLSDKTKEGAKGIIIAKGQPNERKFTYTQAALVLQTLESVAGQRGCFSFGVCQTCKKWDTSCYTAKILGICKVDKKEHSPFDTCDKHSKDGGGFGI